MCVFVFACVIVSDVVVGGFRVQFHFWLVIWVATMLRSVYWVWGLGLYFQRLWGFRVQDLRFRGVVSGGSVWSCRCSVLFHELYYFRV